MSKNRAAARIPDGVQESFTAEEQTQMDLMAEGDKALAPDPIPVPEAPKPDAPAPAPAAADAGKDKEKVPDGDKSGMVPHGALHAEREERKKADALLVEERAARAKDGEERKKLEERLTAILERMAPKPEEPKPEPVPDYETDPAGWIAHTMKTQGKTIDEVQGELKTLREEKTQRAETDKNVSVIRGIMDYAINQEREFKAANPDYDAASKFLLESRQEELSDLGYNEQQIIQMIQGEKLTVAAQAKEQGKNPAELVYKIAQRRGYKKADAAAPVKETPTKAADAVPSAEEVAAKLAKVKEGVQTSASLSDMGGAAPTNLTVTALLGMDDAEFDKWMKTKEGRALMGS